MIADTSDKRTHTFYRLTTSPRVQKAGRVAPPANYDLFADPLLPNRAFSGVMGSERTWWPVAYATAEATAARGVLMTTSPIDLAQTDPSARSSAQRPRECRYPGAWAACSS